MLKDLLQQYKQFIQLLTDHWMTICALTAAGLGIIEITFYAIGGWVDFPMIIWSIAQISATLVMAKWHKNGAWIVGIIVAAGILSPQPVLNSGLLSTLCALVILSNLHLIQAIVLASINTTSLAIFIYKNSILPWSTLFNFLTLYLSAILLGRMVLWHNKTLANRLQQEKEKEQRMIAATIHNEIANGISVAILQLETDNYSTKEISKELKTVLSKIHNVIHVLEQPRDPSSIIQGIYTKDERQEIKQLCIQKDTLLHSLGLRGRTVIQLDEDSINSNTKHLLTQILYEAYTNIGKYADRSRGYIISVFTQAGQIHITATNVIQDHTGDLSGNYGLQQLQSQITDSGGLLQYGPVDSTSREWQLLAIIPE